MDQPTPDRPPPPEPSLVESGPSVGTEPAAAAASDASEGTPEPGPALPGTGANPRDERIAARLQRLVGDDETVTAWARAWVSREVRLHRLLAARTLDFAVMTDASVYLFSTGFFTRRPRRRVYASRFERLFVAGDEVAGGRLRLRVTSRDAHPLWFELDRSERAVAFGAALLGRSGPDRT